MIRGLVHICSFLSDILQIEMGLDLMDIVLGVEMVTEYPKNNTVDEISQAEVEEEHKARIKILPFTIQEEVDKQDKYDTKIHYSLWDADDVWSQDLDLVK